jgi:O-antigen/teichoic acid export membrane protein
MVSDPHSSLDSQMVRKATHAVAWNYASFFLGKVLLFISIAVLARLLTPDEVGVVALAMVAINYFAVVQDLGLGAALIQRRDSIEEAADTVFTLNLICAVLITVLVFLTAPFVAQYFDEEIITPVLRWLGLTFIIHAFGSIHTVLLRRELDFRKKIIPDLGQSIVKGIVSISLALSGAGVWSLVYGQLVGSTAFVVLAWIVNPWRPRLRLNTPLLRPMLRYGLSVLVGDSLSTAIDNLDYVIVGRMFGQAVLGIYSYAYRLPELLIINNLWVMSAVIFPAYSSFQNNLSDMRRAFLGTVRFIQLLALPICLGLIIAADPLIRVAFGKQWLDVIPVARILAMYALVLSIGYHAGGVYKAIGRPDISVKLSVLTLFILAPCLLIGAQYGLTGVALGHLTAVIIRTFIRLYVAQRLIHCSFRDVLAAIRPAAQSAIGLLLCALPVLLLAQDWPVLIQLLLVTAAGATGYLGALWIFERETILKVAQMIGVSRLKKISAAA